MSQQTPQPRHLTMSKSILPEPPQQPPSPEPQASTPSTRPPPNDRLSIPFHFRLPLTTLLSSFTGFALGIAHGGQLASLRFTAENAHRLPTSPTGWYLYHKSKNYNIMFGGIKEGFRMGAKMSFWTGVFFVFEEAVDRFRGAVVRSFGGFRERRREERLRRTGAWDEEMESEEEKALGLERLRDERGIWVQRDFLSTVVAALGTAGGFSAWNRFPVQTAARTAMMGLRVGLGFGIVQDLLSLARGRRLGYVEFVRRQILGPRMDKDETKAVAQPV